MNKLIAFSIVFAMFFMARSIPFLIQAWQVVTLVGLVIMGAILMSITGGDGWWFLR